MKTRIITAIVLIAILVPVVIIGGIPFEVLIGIVGIAGVYELLAITNSPRASIYLYPVLMIYMLVSLFLSNNIIVDSVYIIILLLVLFTFSMVDIDLSIDRIGYYIAGILLISMGLRSILVLRLEYGIHYIIMLAFATFGTDTGAYFAGRYFGSHKLNPRLSPKKTIEGSIGGIILGGILSIVYGIIVNINLTLNMLIIICLVLTITGQIGDLTFSSMKRYFKVKDFSNLLPGHGGILDRFDAFIFNGATIGVILYFLAMVV